MHVWVLVCFKTYCNNLHLYRDWLVCTFLSKLWNKVWHFVVMRVVHQHSWQGWLVIWEVQTLRHQFVTLPSEEDCHEDEDDSDGSEEDCICEVVVTIMKRFLGCWETHWQVLVASSQLDTLPSFLLLRSYMYVDGHENDDDNHDVDDNVYSLTWTTTICNSDSVNYPCPHSSFISMLLIVIHLSFMYILFVEKNACFVRVYFVSSVNIDMYVPANCRKTM